MTEQAINAYLYNLGFTDLHPLNGFMIMICAFMCGWFLSRAWFFRPITKV